jgi:hypothetical protein
MGNKATVGQGFLRIFQFSGVGVIQGLLVQNGCMALALPEILENLNLVYE